MRQILHCQGTRNNRGKLCDKVGNDKHRRFAHHLCVCQNPGPSRSAHPPPNVPFAAGDNFSLTIADSMMSRLSSVLVSSGFVHCFRRRHLNTTNFPITPNKHFSPPNERSSAYYDFYKYCGIIAMTTNRHDTHGFRIQHRYVSRTFRSHRPCCFPASVSPP